MDPPEVERKLAAILSADVVGYSRLMAEDEAATNQAAEMLGRTARALVPEDARLEILGPAPAPIARLRGRHRAMLLFKGTDEALLRRVTEATVDAARRLPREVQVALDARPVNML